MALEVDQILHSLYPVKKTRYANPELVSLNEAIVPEVSVQNSARISAGPRTFVVLLSLYKQAVT